MKAVVIRTFVVDDENLEKILSEIPDEGYLPFHLAEMSSCELDDICSNLIEQDTQVFIA